MQKDKHEPESFKFIMEEHQDLQDKLSTMVWFL